MDLDWGNSVEIENTSREFEIIPKEGVFLGLDISETSSGVCLYENGVKSLYNIALETPEGVDFYEVKLRRELKENLSEVIKGMCLDLIIIEDAFQGINPMVTRKLYAINTAIDELILDGVCSCKLFKRVSNQSWKSWLYKLDEKNLFKGLTDKIRIQECLRLIGIEDSGEGFQDRLDATGLLIGYFLCKDEVDRGANVSKYKLKMEDIEVAYTEDYESIVDYLISKNDCISKMFISEKYWSKKKMLEYSANNPDLVCISSDIVKLGRVAVDLGLPLLEDGGYVVFWVKPSKLKKILEIKEGVV